MLDWERWTLTHSSGDAVVLVPALVPLCGSDMPAREIVATGSLVLAGTALALHLAAALTTTARSTLSRVSTEGSASGESVQGRRAALIRAKRRPGCEKFLKTSRQRRLGTTIANSVDL